MGDLFATCYVIQCEDGYVEPTIYFSRPDCHPEFEMAVEFDHPFEAKAFIRKHTSQEIGLQVGCDEPRRPANF